MTHQLILPQLLKICEKLNVHVKCLSQPARANRCEYQTLSSYDAEFKF